MIDSTTENVAVVIASHLGSVTGNAHRKANGYAFLVGMVLIARIVCIQQVAPETVTDVANVSESTSARAATVSTEQRANNASRVPVVSTEDVITICRTRASVTKDSSAIGVILISTFALFKSHAKTVVNARWIRNRRPVTSVNARSISLGHNVKHR